MDMQGRFVSLWKRAFNQPQDAALRAYEDLASMYRQPHRHYHTLPHIAACLQAFDTFMEASAEPPPSPPAAELALWYHDVVYVVGPTPRLDNEMNSAAFFLTAAGRTGTRNHALLAEVVRGILATMHGHAPETRMESLVVDADLAGLGAAYPVFQLNMELIRREMPGLTDEEFAKGQADFLHKKFLARTRGIYTTLHFRNKYEAAATGNIQRYRTDSQ